MLLLMSFSYTPMISDDWSFSSMITYASFSDVLYEFYPACTHKVFWVTDGFLINHLTVKNKHIGPLAPNLTPETRGWKSHGNVFPKSGWVLLRERWRAMHFTLNMQDRDSFLQKRQKQQQNSVAPSRCWKEPWDPTLPDHFGIWICFSKDQVNQGVSVI